MSHERYIINEEEIALLDWYEGTMPQGKGSCGYDILSAEAYKQIRPK